MGILAPARGQDAALRGRRMTHTASTSGLARREQVMGC